VVQRAARLQASVGNQVVLRQAAQIHDAARLGTSGASGRLPHLAAIQRSFGAHDLSQVAAHTDAAAAAGARAMGAAAFTTGDRVAFAGEPSLHTAAHEAAHVIQQRDGVQLASGVGVCGDRYERHADEVADLVVANRSAEALLGAIAPPPPGPSTDAVQREAIDDTAPSESASPPRSRAPKAHYCAPSSTACPRDFCVPFETEADAIGDRNQWATTLLAGIAGAVGSAVVSLWNQYIYGGAPLQDLTTQFGPDFTNSSDTRTATIHLARRLSESLRRDPPTFPPASDTTTVDLAERIGPAIAELDQPGGTDRMYFGHGDIPGNIAGDIGKDEVSCPAGARPSPVDDAREASGTATVTRHPDGTLSFVPLITYTVTDTIDLCPGDCGGRYERIATERLSRWEATGISGDVPFRVVFPSRPETFDVRTPKAGPHPGPPPSHDAPPKKP
jgi:hypothetical protein